MPRRSPAWAQTLLPTDPAAVAGSAVVTALRKARSLASRAAATSGLTTSEEAFLMALTWRCCWACGEVRC